MVVKFLSPIANASQFPVPSVSATPKFHLTDVNVMLPSDLKLSRATYTRNGRGAIGIAGKALKKTGRNVILIPAYHCPALVEPFIWLGYEIRFYPVMGNLHIDQEALKAELNKGDVTHCVVVRYFGFNQNVDSIVQFLTGFDVAIIEDCAHSMFKFVEHFSIDKEGNDPVDASICSINKILPTVDGGALYLKDPSKHQLIQTSWTEELKAFAFLMGVPQMLDRLRTNNKAVNHEVKQAQPVETDEAALRYFKAVDIQSASYRHTHYILAKSNLKKIRNKRRANFEYLLKNINNPEAGEALFSELDKDVPYVMPFLLKDEKHFFTLRKLGIQILRWEEVAISDCEVSSQYRSRLIQIPCHHQLNKTQLDFVVQSINQLTP